MDSSYIRTGNRRNSSCCRNRDNPSNTRRSVGIRRNILRTTETLFRRSRKRGYPLSRVDAY